MLRCMKLEVFRPLMAAAQRNQIAPIFRAKQEKELGVISVTIRHRQKLKRAKDGALRDPTGHDSSSESEYSDKTKTS